MSDFFFNIEPISYSDRVKWFQEHNYAPHLYPLWMCLVASITLLCCYVFSNSSISILVIAWFPFVIGCMYYLFGSLDYKGRKRLATRFYITSISLEGMNLTLSYMDEKDAVHNATLSLSEYEISFYDYYNSKILNLDRRGKETKGMFAIYKKGRANKESVVYDNPFTDSFYQYCVMGWDYTIFKEFRKSYQSILN